MSRGKKYSYYTNFEWYYCYGNIFYFAYSYQWKDLHYGGGKQTDGCGVIQKYIGRF